jgi:hypothetical protein
MANIFYFTGGGRASKHYEDTILRNIHLTKFEHLLSDSERQAYLARHEGISVNVWGAVPGKMNSSNWEYMKEGDIVFIYKDGQFSHAGEISFKMRNRKIANYFWGTDENRNTWELIYFIKGLQKIDCPLRTFRKSADFKGQWVPQGFAKFTDDRINWIKNEHGSIEAFFHGLGLDRKPTLKQERNPPLELDLERVEKPEEILENVDNFIDDYKKYRQRSDNLMRTSSYWVFEPNKEIFCPSKFAGYKKMSFGKYEHAARGKTTGALFDGAVTRMAIEKALSQQYSSDNKLAKLLREWVNNNFGTMFFSGIDIDKWKFVALPKLGFPIRSFSWEILSDSIAIKHLDESAFVHNGTGIPKEICPFFRLENFLEGKNKPTTFIYKGKSFKAYFYVDPTKRVRLHWYSDFAGTLKSELPEWFERFSQNKKITDEPPVMRLKVLDSDIREYEITLTFLDFIKQNIDDIIEQEIKNNTKIDETVKEALVKARRGQGRFRKNLESIEKSCRITRVTDLRLLRASHAKPWRDCANNHERLDGNNGLLLAPHIDHLFDRGYISFSNEGNLLVSTMIDSGQLSLLGVSSKPPPNVGPFNDKQKHYLKYHRTKVFLDHR